MRGVTLLPNSAIQRNDNSTFVFTCYTKRNQTVPVKPSRWASGGNASEVQGLPPGTVLAADNFNRSAIEQGIGTLHWWRGADVGCLSQDDEPVATPFILPPIATSLLMLAVLLSGAIAYKRFPLSRRCRRRSVSNDPSDHVLSRRES